MLSRFLKEDDGQATTEYVFLIFFLVSIIFTVGMSFQAMISNLFTSKLGDKLISRFFNPDRMHRFPIAIPK